MTEITLKNYKFQISDKFHIKNKGLVAVLTPLESFKEDPILLHGTIVEGKKVIQAERFRCGGFGTIPEDKRDIGVLLADID